MGWSRRTRIWVKLRSCPDSNENPNHEAPSIRTSHGLSACRQFPDMGTACHCINTPMPPKQIHVHWLLLRAPWPKTGILQASMGGTSTVSNMRKLHFHVWCESTFPQLDCKGKDSLCSAKELFQDVLRISTVVVRENPIDVVGGNWLGMQCCKRTMAGSKNGV